MKLTNFGASTTVRATITTHEWLKTTDYEMLSVGDQTPLHEILLQ